jgi:hypothetical protein
MRHLGKYLGLLSVLGVAGVCSIVTSAKANTSSDELYSETIYIQKSSAEVPTSLESNARPNAEADLTAASDEAIESITDLDNAAPAKKVSQRRGSKKTASN